MGPGVAIKPHTFKREGEGQIIKFKGFKYKWVVVLEDTPQKFSNGMFILEKGDMCILLPGAPMKYLGPAETKDVSVFQLVTEEDIEGTSCQNGARFEIGNAYVIQ